MYHLEDFFYVLLSMGYVSAELFHSLSVLGRYYYLSRAHECVTVHFLDFPSNFARDVGR